MIWIDAHLLALLLLIPCGAIFFIGFIPRFDTASVRQICLAASVLILAGLGRLGWLTFQGASIAASPVEIILLSCIAVCVLGLFYCRFKPATAIESRSAFILMLLVFLAFLAICAQDFETSVLIASFSWWPVFFLIALDGGPRKGSAIMTTSIAALSADLAAIFAISLPFGWLSVLLFLPAFARFLHPIVSPWHRIYAGHAPGLALFAHAAILMPLGAALFLKATQFVPQFKDYFFIIRPAAIVGIVLAVILMFSETLATRALIYQLTILCAFFVYGSTLLSDATQVLVLFFVAAILCVAFGLIVLQIEGASQRLLSAALILVIGLPGIGYGTILWLAMPRPLTAFIGLALFCSSLATSRLLGFAPELGTIALWRPWLCFFVVVAINWAIPIWFVFGG